jgi:hypothetical protein
MKVAILHEDACHLRISCSILPGRLDDIPPIGLWPTLLGTHGLYRQCSSAGSESAIRGH